MGVVRHLIDIAKPRELAAKRTEPISGSRGGLLIDVSIPCEPVPSVSDIANLQREVVAERVRYTQAVICDIGSFEVRVNTHNGALTWILWKCGVAWRYFISAGYHG